MKYFITFALCLVTLNSCGNNDSIPSKIDLLSSSATAMEKAHQTGNAEQFIQAANRINKLMPSFWVFPDSDSRLKGDLRDYVRPEFQDWIDSSGVNNTAYLNKLALSLDKLNVHYGRVIIKPKTKRPLDVRLHQEIISDPYMLDCIKNHKNIINYVFVVY